MIETELTCPLGSTCEKVVDGKIHRCAWYTTLEGVNPQNGERLENTSRCAMTWLPMLMIDNTGKTSAVVSGIVDLRESVLNEATSRLQQFDQFKGLGHEENSFN